MIGLPDQEAGPMLFGRSILVRSAWRFSLLLPVLTFFLLTSCSEDAPNKVAAPPDTTPPVITSGPDASFTQTGVRVTWTTDEPSDAVLQISASGDFSYAIFHIGPSGVTDHAILLEHDPNRYGDEFVPGATYQYRARSTNDAGLTSEWVTGTFTFQP
jgi:hypothetical protein